MRDQIAHEEPDATLEDKMGQDFEEVSFCGSWLDSKTSQLDDALLEKIEKAVHKTTAQVQQQDLVKIAFEYDPIDLAHALPKIPPSARLILYQCLHEIKAKASFIINASSAPRISLLRILPDEEIKSIIQHVPADDAVNVLEDLPSHRVRRLLDLLDYAKRQKIVALLRHGRSMAGRLMTNEFFAFHLLAKVGDVVHFIRDNPGLELTAGVFVLNDSSELIGIVPDRTLLVNSKDVPLRTLMRQVIHRATAETSREEIVELFERYHLPILPVVDEKEHLLGVITQDDVIEVLEEIANETIAKIGGTAEEVSEYEPTWKRFLARAPWLLVTLFAGLLTSSGLAFFYEYPWFLIVPFFVPLITGMSGNVGIQCSTVLVRGMATGEISPGIQNAVIVRELKVGSLIGVGFGLLCGLVVYLLNIMELQHIHADPVLVGVVVSSGVFGACLTATVLGTLSPLFFAKFRIDPAIASGPIVTAFNDVLSTYMYFFVSWLAFKAFLWAS
jgi:magnesium transporter